MCKKWSNKERKVREESMRKSDLWDQSKFCDFWMLICEKIWGAVVDIWEQAVKALGFAYDWADGAVGWVIAREFIESDLTGEFLQTWANKSRIQL